MSDLFKRLLHPFVCQHLRYSFPQTDPRTGLTTVVCADCTKRFTYDWSRMARGAEV